MAQSSKQKQPRHGGAKKNLLLPAAAAVAMALAAVVGVGKRQSANADAPTLAATVRDGRLVIQTKALSSTVQYVDYDAGGTAMQLLAVKDANNVAHVTLNTCQNCNGSPRAYFLQNGGAVTCQNCGISHNISQLGVQKLGCNPVPLRHTDNGGEISIDTAELNRYAPMFANWKRGI